MARKAKVNDRICKVDIIDKVKVLGTNVLLKPLFSENTTKAKLVLSDSSYETIIAEVVSVGDGYNRETGVKRNMHVKKGDIVLLDYQVKLNRECHIFVDIDEVPYIMKDICIIEALIKGFDKNKNYINVVRR